MDNSQKPALPLDMLVQHLLGLGYSPIQISAMYNDPGTQKMLMGRLGTSLGDTGLNLGVSGMYDINRHKGVLNNIDASYGNRLGDVRVGYDPTQKRLSNIGAGLNLDGGKGNVSLDYNPMMKMLQLMYRGSF